MPNESLDAHLFICTNHKDKGESCGPKGAQQLRELVKTEVQSLDPELKSRIRVNAAGCLGRCSEGITAVLYPKGQWFTQLIPDDPSLLVQELQAVVRPSTEIKK